jgi:hypothetical protein
MGFAGGSWPAVWLGRIRSPSRWSPNPAPSHYGALRWVLWLSQFGEKSEAERTRLILWIGARLAAFEVESRPRAHARRSASLKPDGQQRVDSVVEWLLSAADLWGSSWPISEVRQRPVC